MFKPIFAPEHGETDPNAFSPMRKVIFESVVDLGKQEFQNSIEDAPNPPIEGEMVVFDDTDDKTALETAINTLKKLGVSTNFLETFPPCQNVAGFEPSPLLVPDSLYQNFLFYLYQVMGKTDGVAILEIESRIKHPEAGGNHAALVAAYLYDKGQKSKYGPVQNILARHEVEKAKFKQLDAECFPIKRPRPSKAKQ